MHKETSALYRVNLLQDSEADGYTVKVEDAMDNELTRYTLFTENYDKAWRHTLNCFKRLKMSNSDKHIDYYIEGPYYSRARAIYGADDLDVNKIQVDEKDFYEDLMDKFLILINKSYFANKAFRVVVLQNNLNIHQENKLLNLLIKKRAL